MANVALPKFVLLTLIAALSSLFCAPSAVANTPVGAPVEVVALFKNRAVIRTADGQQMLKVGESKGEITLRAASPHGATIDFRGKLYELSLSSRVAASFVQPEKASVSLNQDQRGQYRVRGAINMSPVTFLVDTGASLIAMSERHARAVGLDYSQAEVGKVQTAQGLANAYFTNLAQVSIGGIMLHNVKATVITGDYPTDVLLGMSFLNQVNMRDMEGVLTLTARF